MPTISRFHGIKIEMYYDDHPPPHYHAIYGEYKVEIDINTGQIIAGRFPRSKWKLIRKWAVQHQTELSDNWTLARAHEDLEPIQPLK